MLNIFVEANCNRYVRDECTYCHVYEPLSKIDRSDWHLLPEQAQVMANQRRRQPERLGQLADRGRLVETGENDPEPARIAHQAKHLGQLARLVVGQSLGHDTGSH